MERSEAGIIKKNILFNICRTLMNVAYPVVTFSYAARILTVDDMGSVMFSRNYVSYFLLLALLGVSYYGVREGARLAKDRVRFQKFFLEINMINIVATICASMIFFVSIFVVDKLYGYRILLLISSVGILLSGLGNEWVLISFEEYRYLAIRTLLIQLACIALIVFFVRSQEDYVIYCAILLLSSSGPALFNWAFLIKNKLLHKVPLHELEIKKHLKPIFVLFAMLASIDLYTMLDTTMLGFIKSDYEVGIYNAAIKIPRLANSVIASVGAVLVPRLSYYYDVDKEHFQRLIDKAQNFIIFITVPACVGIVMMAKEIVLVFAGDQYESAFLTTRLLAPLTLIIPISVLFNNQVFIPMRKEMLVLKSTCVGAAVNLILNGLLIPSFAENGAAIASVAAELSVMMVCVYHVKKELKTQVVWKKYLWAVITSVSIVLVCLLTEKIIDNTYLRLGFAVITCGCVYVLLNVKTIKQIMDLR